MRVAASLASVLLIGTLLSGCATTDPAPPAQAAASPEAGDIAIRTQAPEIVIRTESPTPLSTSSAPPASKAPASEASAAPQASPSSTQRPSDSPGKQDNAALAALESIQVKGRAPKTGYDRDLFGSGWLDTDRNGCDARNDILARDLQVGSYKPGTGNCVVLTGTLVDPYTKKTIDFVRGQGTSNDVQIDHVVALSDAWQKGAQNMPEATRREFANDPLNLLAVDGPTNASKGDSDAASWLPPNRGYWCEYVTRQIEVKSKYELWMTAAEQTASARVLKEHC